jgi:hypothetical protein
MAFLWLSLGNEDLRGAASTAAVPWYKHWDVRGSGDLAHLVDVCFFGDLWKGRKPMKTCCIYII